MKSLFAVFISIVLLIAIWFVAAFFIHVLAFNAPMMSDSIIAEYLNKGATWFVAPGVGAYWSLIAVHRFLGGIDIKTIFVSMLTILVLVWLVLAAFIILIFGKAEYASYGGLIQLFLQGFSIFIGLKLGKIELTDDETNEKS